MTASRTTLLVLLAAAAALVVATSPGLPPIVASHFGAGGQANGFMTRAGYVTFTLLLMSGMAAVFGGLPILLRRLPTKLVSLPNRDYWLAPERKDATLEDMERRMRWLGCAQLVFLSYVHHLLVQANAVTPPVLPERAFLLGMAGFALAIVAWGAALILRYRRPRA